MKAAKSGGGKDSKAKQEQASHGIYMCACLRMEIRLAELDAWTNGTALVILIKVTLSLMCTVLGEMRLHGKMLDCPCKKKGRWALLLEDQRGPNDPAECQHCLFKNCRLVEDELCCSHLRPQVKGYGLRVNVVIRSITWPKGILLLHHVAQKNEERHGHLREGNAATCYNHSVDANNVRGPGLVGHANLVRAHSGIKARSPAQGSALYSS
eukprot:scaffold69233_cov21-Tisochrysis_lutea.AAC.3